MFTKLQSALSTVSNKNLAIAGIGCAVLGGFGLGYVSGRIHGRKKAPVVAVDEVTVDEVATADATVTEA